MSCGSNSARNASRVSVIGHLLGDGESRAFAIASAVRLVMDLVWFEQAARIVFDALSGAFRRSAN